MGNKNLTASSELDALTKQQTAAQRRAVAKLQKLAAERGVKPLTSDELLALGDLWPEDESVDDFLAALREQRRDRTTRRLP
jgi:hypothetical protein